MVLILIFAGYFSPANFFHPQKRATCRSTDPELDFFCRGRSRQSSCTCWGDHRCLYIILFLCGALTSHRVHVDEKGCSQTTLQLLIRRRGWFDYSIKTRKCTILLPHKDGHLAESIKRLTLVGSVRCWTTGVASKRVWVKKGGSFWKSGPLYTYVWKCDFFAVDWWVSCRT